MRVVGDPDDLLLVNLNGRQVGIIFMSGRSRSMISDSSHVQRSLQLARGRAEAVEDEVLADAVDPLAARRDLTGDEVAALALSGGEGADDLSSHVDDGDVVRAVAHHDLEEGQAQYQYHYKLDEILRACHWSPKYDQAMIC